VGKTNFTEVKKYIQENKESMPQKD